MEDNNQQWSWTMAVEASLALYGICSLHNWVASIISNFRFRPQQTPLVVPAAPPHPSKLNLPAFWISDPAAWFVFAEAKFRTNNITSQRVMFDLLVAALQETTLAQVMDIINNILAVNPLEILKLRLLEAHVLSDQEKMDALFQLGPLGDRKPSQLLASMLSVCPLGMEIQPVFQYLFLQWLPQTLRTLLGEQDCGNIRALAALVNRLWPSHKPQLHEVMAVQEPAGDQKVAAIQPKKKTLKKKSGGGSGFSGNGASGSIGSILSHAEQARVGSGLCFKHS
jgi:hypothetical protein